MDRKGILLAGGKGTRFSPVTNAISKHLLPIFDKPMIYYSLSTLMLAGIKEILIISTHRDIPLLKNLLGDGSSWGIKLFYKIQDSPDGIAQSFIIAEDFLDDSPCVLILGDNFFYGDGLKKKLKNINNRLSGATIFGCRVKDPERYGVIELDNEDKIISLIEKPKNPISEIAITGLYFFDENATKYAKTLSPSERGELEITDLIDIYLENDMLFLEKLGRGYAWLDAGTPESLLEASQFVQTLEHRQYLKISCPEEISFKNGWISKERVLENIKNMNNKSYQKYIMEILYNS